MDTLIVFTLSIDDIDGLILANKYTLVANLATHLSIEWCVVKNKLVETILLLCHFTITEDVTFILGIVVTNELLFAFTQHFPVTILNDSSITGTRFLLCHFLIELLFINSIAILSTDKFCQIEWETIGVKQTESLFTIQLGLTVCLQFIHSTTQQANTLIQSTEERVFLFLHHTCNQLTLCSQFGVSNTHLMYQNIDQLVHKGFFLTEERISITHGTTKDTTDNITCFGIAWQLTVSNGECNSTQMVGNNTHSDIYFLLFIDAFTVRTFWESVVIFLS